MHIEGHEIKCDNKNEQQDIIHFFKLLYDQNVSLDLINVALKKCLAHPCPAGDVEQIKAAFQNAIEKRSGVTEEKSVSPQGSSLLFPPPKCKFSQDHYKEASSLITQLIFEALLSDKFSLSLDANLRSAKTDMVSLAELGEYRYQIAVAQEDPQKNAFGLSRLSEEYDLLLVSKLPAEKEAKENVIYLLENNGSISYAVLDPRKKLRSGSLLKSQLLSKEELENSTPLKIILSDQEKKADLLFQILSITAASGHTFSSMSMFHHTPLREKYAPYADEFCKLFAEELEYTEFSLSDEGVPLYRCSMEGEMKNDQQAVTIPVTKLLPEAGHNTWIHADKTVIEIILKCLDKKIKNLHLSQQQPIDVNDKAELAAFVKEVAEIHWWFSHAMPFARGSASVGESLIKAIFQCKGLDVSPKNKLMLDCIALTYPRIEKFSDNYLDLVKIEKFALAENRSRINLLRNEINSFFGAFNKVENLQSSGQKPGCSQM